jgi:hypothetical protein
MRPMLGPRKDDSVGWLSTFGVRMAITAALWGSAIGALPLGLIHQ